MIKQEIYSDMPPAMFQDCRMPKDFEEADHVRLMMWACFFYPLRVGSKTRYWSLCAYSAKSVTAIQRVKVGFAYEPGTVQGHLDHIVARTKGGPDHPLNYQMLSAGMNNISIKGAKPTIHSRFQAFRQDGTIDHQPFESRFAEFLYAFNRHHELGERSPFKVPMIVCWPWHLRRDDKRRTPFAPGYDERRRVMRVSPEESWMIEFKILAQHAENYCRLCDDSDCVRLVNEAWEEKLNCSLGASANVTIS